MLTNHAIILLLKKLLQKVSAKAPLLALFAVIFAFRWWFGMTHDAFGQDVARDLYLAESWRDSGTWVVPYGPKASVGNFYLPPFYYQVHIWASALTNDHPHTMKAFVILLESLTPLVLFGVLRHLGVTKRVAMLLAATYAISYLPTMFGIFAWNPNTIPFFSLLGLLLWLQFVKSQNGWLLLLYPLTVAIAVSFHYQAVVLVPFAVIAAFAIARLYRSYLPWLIAGVVLAALPFAPYFSYEASHGWQNMHAITRYFSSEHSQYYDRISKPAYVLTFFPNFIELIFTGTDLNPDWYGYVVYFVGGACLFLAALKRDGRHTRWVLFYLLSLALMLRVYKGDKLEYYLSTLYVLPVLLLGALSLYSRRLAVGLTLLAVFFAGSNLAKQPTEHGITQLFETIEYVSEYALEKPVRLLFHTDDHVNTLAYGLAKLPIVAVDQSSRLLVEVCNPNDPCQWDTVLRCRESRPFTYATLLKYERGYTQISEHTFMPRYTVVIGELGTEDGAGSVTAASASAQNYRPYLIDEKYGTDLVMTEWVEY